MASLEELLRYLEQFMSGHLYQHQQQAGASRIGGLSGPIGGPAGMVGGGVPSGGVPGGGIPGGGTPGGGGSADQVPQPPPELANAPPEQVQQALQQFAELHPGLASYLPAGGEPFTLAAALGHLGGLPGEALEGYSPALAELELSELGGLLSEEAGSGGFDGFDSGSFGTVGAATAAEPSFSDLDHLLGGLDVDGGSSVAGESPLPFGDDLATALPFGDLSADFSSPDSDLGAAAAPFSDFSSLDPVTAADTDPAVDLTGIDFSSLDDSAVADPTTNLVSDTDLSFSGPASDVVQGGVTDDDEQF